jgi:hypothetical protein
MHSFVNLLSCVGSRLARGAFGWRLAGHEMGRNGAFVRCAGTNVRSQVLEY